MPILIALLSTNLTDILIGLFGWETMQLLWSPLEALFAMLNALVPAPEMWGTVWEALFT